MRILAAVLAISAFGSAAAAQTWTNPKWIRKPSAAEVSRNYPPEAGKRGLSGKTMIVCVISLNTRLENCRIKSESPAGMKFGEAAIHIMERYGRVQPALSNGKPVEGVELSIPFSFDQPKK